MTKKNFKSLLFTLMCGLCAFSAPAAVSLFSDYGQIQNVQFYSSSPFWSPNSPYNQRLPQPVYVQGADLNAGDCIKIVQSLVSVQCMTRDNCKNAVLSDIRPAIMVQLSSLPGHNYVSACSGYIDGVFESYKKQSENTVQPTVFPNAVLPNPDFQDNDDDTSENSAKINPLKKTLPKWQQEMNERSAELLALQHENGTGIYEVSAVGFPKTIDDYSFSERMQNAQEGFLPYKDLKPFKELNVLSKAEWCNENPDSPECKPVDNPSQCKVKHNS